MRESAARAFWAYGRLLDMVTSFKYLERIMTASDENWQAVVGNLRKARKIWSRLERIMGREGASPRLPGVFLKVFVQAVLIFGSETLVMTPRMSRDLGVFQHRVSRRITGRKAKRQVDGSW